MKINFFYESGEINEIGTGHKYRSAEIGHELERRGHEVTYLSSERADIIIIDHMLSQKDIIKQNKSRGTKVVLIDGAEEDVSIVDLSISAFLNKQSEYRGVKYVVFPRTMRSIWNKYRTYTKSNNVFVSLGGFDAKNIVHKVLDAVYDTGMSAIVTKSINHGNLKSQFSNIEVIENEDYYDAMSECVIGITNGGLTMFQALFFGLPTMPIPQYEHQEINIGYVQHCCLPTKDDKDDIVEKIGWLRNSSYYRTNLSHLAMHYVDGKGTQRVCALIEGLK